MNFLIRSKRAGELFSYSLLIFVTTLLFFFTYRLWNYDFMTYPLVYSHDGIESLKLIKNIIENGSHWSVNDQLGTPAGSNLYLSFPTADLVPLTIIKIIAQFTSNHFLIFNIYVFLTYLLTSITSFWVLQKLKINKINSILGALLFSFLPYHQIRTIIGHIFLLSYFTVPMSLLIGFKILENKWEWVEFIRVKQITILLVFLFLIASSGTAYYAFFSIGIWGICALISSISEKKFKPILGWAVLCFITGVFTLINILPSLSYQHQTGHSIFIERDLKQIEEFSLRLNRILVPLPSKVMSPINTFLDKYYQDAQHEQFQYLGLVAMIGFFILIQSLFKKNTETIQKKVALLVIGIIVWTMSGGLATLFGYLVTSSIRSYGRISIYIAFLSIWTVMVIWQRLLIKKNSQKIFYLMSFIIVGFSLLDQVHVIDAHQNGWLIRKTFEEDKELMARVGEVLPVGTMIYQLPAVTYPEASGQCGFDSYDHFKPYLHTSKYKWSFGTVSDSVNSEWYQQVSTLAISPMLVEISKVGFNAIYIDTRACLDAWGIQAEIAEITKGNLYTSKDFHSLVIDISEYAEVTRDASNSGVISGSGGI